jgi:hypothetical protein
MRVRVSKFQIRWRVQPDDAANRRIVRRVGGRQRNLPARRAPQQNQPQRIDPQFIRPGRQKCDRRAKIVTLRRPEKFRREPVGNGRHRVTAPRDPVVELQHLPAIAIVPTAAVYHDHARHRPATGAARGTVEIQRQTVRHSKRLHRHRHGIPAQEQLRKRKRSPRQRLGAEPRSELPLHDRRNPPSLECRLQQEHERHAADRHGDARQDCRIALKPPRKRRHEYGDHRQPVAELTREQRQLPGRPRRRWHDGEQPQS